jgi:hypothetical protein
VILVYIIGVYNSQAVFGVILIYKSRLVKAKTLTFNKRGNKLRKVLFPFLVPRIHV